MKAHHVSNWNTSELEFGVTTYRTDEMWDTTHYWTRHVAGSFVNQMNLGQRMDELRKILTGCDRCGRSYDMLFEEFEKMSWRAKYSSEILKEYVFEDVRQDHYSALPSRRSCMFLFERTVDAAHALETLGRRKKLDDYSVLEIKLDHEEGRIHCADMTLLDCNDNLVEDYEEEAHRYWSGHHSDSGFVEILYEGPFQILGVLESE